MYNKFIFVYVIFICIHLFLGDVKDETYTSEKNRDSGYETNLYLYSVSTKIYYV